MRGNTSKQNFKVLIILLIIIVLIVISYNNLYNSSEEDSSEENEKINNGDSISIEMWEEDIDYLADQLKAKHKDIFFNISKKEFNVQINSLKDNLPNLNEDQIKVEIKKIVASIGDSHTKIKYENMDPQYGYPFRFYWFNDGIYVTNTIRDYEDSLYCKLVKIDGKEIDDIIEILTSVISYENPSWFSYTVPYYLTFTDILYGLDIITDKEKTTFTFVDDKGDLFDMNVKSVEFGKYMDALIERGDLPIYMQNKNYYYWYKYFPNEKVLYFQYNKCANMESKDFNIFLDELFETAENNSTEKLVIDLRNNTGGIKGIFDPFIEELSNYPNLNKESSLFVLIGRSTYSIGLDYVIELDKETNAIFIGEPTGEKPNHFGESKTFELNNSGIIVNYSTKFIKLSDEKLDSFEPDIQVEYWAKDFFNNIDPCLELIFSNY